MLIEFEHNDDDMSFRIYDRGQELNGFYDCETHYYCSIRSFVYVYVVSVAAKNSLLVAAQRL
jgi:hypothetical protein